MKLWSIHVQVISTFLVTVLVCDGDHKCLETATTSVTDVLSAQTGDPMHVAEPSSAEEVARAKQLEACVKNWKAASSEDKKKMWGVFDEAGVFASACRHGLILWIADMLRSGEL